jgi:hypothetical protein
MTSKEFVIWLNGFVDAAHEYAPTPKQWDLLKEKLQEVEDKTLILESPKFPFGTPNTTPMWQHPHYVDPYNPYKITCSSGSFGTTITTTPGQSSITIANPPFGFGVTSTAYGYPSGSAWSYTTSNEKIF